MKESKRKRNINIYLVFVCFYKSLEKTREQGKETRVNPTLSAYIFSIRRLVNYYKKKKQEKEKNERKEEKENGFGFTDEGFLNEASSQRKTIRD
jgi:hypothetical protein